MYTYLCSAANGYITGTLQNNLYYVFVYGSPKMAPVKRHAYKAQSILKAISYMVVNENRAAAREFNEFAVLKWRKQENELGK